ncbi:solute carrier organic anion transporter family member 74D [Schistocerca cancellata]|uniref:solute carrier organic anion transporter family member 74D n=1 Tax=Schistocerca cancellata TaxID=274614 RepID=UPI002118527A|nr:solute carrier organic anion transporter family member 74D [Schistocerca cancellata]XP_049762910.1 solute carrier organic anion transporter family member 74D [Schistocerca cancellata]
MADKSEKNGDAKRRPGELTPEEEEQLYRDHPLTDDTTCGYGPLRSAFLQKFANKKAFVFLYGILGCVYSATYSYYNGTITTIEKRFKIPSKTIGFISIGNDISTMLVSAVITYYAGRGHRPRWMTFGLYTVVAFCLLNALPHLLYGAGQDSLMLTREYGATANPNETSELIEEERRKVLCRPEGGVPCDSSAGSLAPQLILFGANFIAGIGGSLYYTLGTSYMDDNIKKSKTPALISLSYFLRMLGPAIGYSLASLCLKFFISPSLTPTITTKDPRWLGAWWIGWMVLAVMLFVMATVIGLFPKQLPRAAVRRMIEQERLRAKGDKAALAAAENPPERTSLSDMMKTFKRLLRNSTLMCNNLAGIFYFVGYSPYWIFMPKYIETQYRQSASVSSLVTGTVGLVFSAVGILTSGLVISKFRPRARYLAGWNVIVGIVTVMGMVSYVFLGCDAGDATTRSLLHSGELSEVTKCNADCNCDYVPYAPVCTADGRTTFISACHAGCGNYYINDNGTKVYTECSCVPRANVNGSWASEGGGEVLAGACPVDCMRPFITFLAIVCLLKFVGSTGRASNFLVSVRCVDEKDKPVAMGFGLTLMSLLAFVPAPIFFGYLLDSTCLVWGKTCAGTGNCWLYNGESLRYMLNLTSAAFVTVGTIFDAGVWYFVKDLKIFDEEVKPKEVEDVQEKIVLEE